jgi:hypothetical protein
VGITTLVTVMVLLLMATFATLSLASARSDLALSQIAAQSVEDYYQADSEAVRWYAQLDSFAAGLSTAAQDWRAELTAAGYQVTLTDAGELRVSEVFIMGGKRQLVVTVAINADRSTTIRQWQT